MALFSHAFIRKRVISLATSASVAATSFALAQDPAKTRHVRDGREHAPDQQAHGAIDTAKAKLNYGDNEQFRRLAQRNAATQQPEITLMQDAVSDGKSFVAQLPEQSRVVLRNRVRLAARSAMTE
jgi:Domain of unknown function (DUF305)